MIGNHKWNLNVSWLILMLVFFVFFFNLSGICLLLHSFQTYLQLWRHLLLVAFFSPEVPFVLLLEQLCDPQLALLKIWNKWSRVLLIISKQKSCTYLFCSTSTISGTSFEFSFEDLIEEGSLGVLYRDELLLNDTFCVPNIIVFTIMWLSFSANNVWPEVFGGDWYKMHWNIFVIFEWHEHYFLCLNLGFQFTLNFRVELAEFGDVLGSAGVSHVWIDIWRCFWLFTAIYWKRNCFLW